MENQNNFLGLLQSLRLPDNFSNSVGGIKLPTKPSFGKLSDKRFSRVHPGADYQLPIFLVDDKDAGEVYLCTHEMSAYLGKMAQPKLLRLAVDNSNTPKIIAQPILDQVSRPNLWHTSMIEAIELAEVDWIRIQSNMPAGQYDIIRAASDLGEPQWPSESMDKLIEAVFLGHVISDPSHPLVRQLQGAV